MGTPGGNTSQGNGIDALDRVWGFACTAGSEDFPITARTHAAVFHLDGRVQELGTLDGQFSSVQAVTPEGQGIGTSGAWAFTATAEQGIMALPILQGFHYCSGSGIASGGASVGVCTQSTGPQHPGPILTTDVYVGVILPDGVNTLFLTNFSPLEGVMTTMSSDPRTFARLLRNVSWPAGMRATQHEYFTHTFTGLEPSGTYHFLVGWTKPNSLEDGRIDEGNVLALAWAPFTFTRGGTEALYAKMQAIRARQAK